MLFISISQLETNAENADLEIEMMSYLMKPRKVLQAPNISPSKFHLPFSYDLKF